MVKLMKNFFRKLFNIDKVEQQRLELEQRQKQIADLELQLSSKQQEIDKCEIVNKGAEQIRLKLLEEKNNLAKEVESLKNQDTDLEKWCKSKYLQINNIAYKQKRKIKGLSYSIFLNEMITPYAFEVAKFQQDIPVKQDLFERAVEIGRKVAKSLVWTSDTNLDSSGDYYLYPSETIVLKDCDCEDHAFLVASLEKNIGVAYGFYKNGTQEIGHAFNVLVYNDELWVLETTGNDVEIMRYKEDEKYRIHFIITRNYTFQLNGGVRFGEIAGY